ncbi:MAG: ABC transporter substrate-binding protein, partial [Gammaproteobacteria bacterium]
MKLVARIVFQLCAAIAFLSSPTVYVEPLPAAKVVQRFQQEVLAIIKEAETLGFEGRYARFEPVVRETHDLAAIAALAVGRKWRSLEEAQR